MPFVRDARASIGAMTERVTIQQPAASADGQGGQTTTWSTLATVWAAIRPWVRGGGEYLYAGAKNQQADYEIEIRYRGDVTPQMRVQWTPYQGIARTLEIVQMYPLDGKRDRLLLDVIELR
jgi:SPP1 family predicted phage head-tail adaptor